MRVMIRLRRKAWVLWAAVMLACVAMAQAEAAASRPHAEAGSVYRAASVLGEGQAETGTEASGTFGPATSRIKHVVIIYQENHSFDDLLGRLCERRVPTCDGYTGPVTFADGTVARNVLEPDIVPIVVHNHRGQRRALHDKWDQIGGCERDPYRCVTHAVPSQIPNLARMATKFVVSDRTFEAVPTASWGSHFRLASGTGLGFFIGDNPTRSVTGAEPRIGWGCPSHKDAWWRGEAWVPACVPDRAGRGPYRSSPVPYHATLMQRLERRHLTWHIYQGVVRHKRPPRGAWQFCTYFYWCSRNRSDFGHISPVPGFAAAARGQRPMANVSFVLPNGALSQHNSASLKRGDNYIGTLVHAVMVGPRWRSTAIFITYDDCGCFYDHVEPPPGRGFRLPMVIVSPWVKRAHTDTQTTALPYGMQAFIEHNFGLEPLSREVSTSYDYHRAFDFHQQPLSGTKVTRQSISARERARLRALAPTWKGDIS
jgi:phospholipase C